MDDTLSLTEVFSTGHYQTLETIIGDLDERYPDVCPDHTLPMTEIAFRAGAISVVRYLKSLRPDN